MHDLGEQKLRYNWQTPILLSKHSQDVFYFGANKLYRSLNKGEALTAVTSDLTNGKKQGNTPYGTITTISESPLKFGLLYVGTDDGNIQVSKDGGYTFSLINVSISLTKIPTNLWVSRVTASQYKEGRVFATLNGYRFDDFTPYLFISEDYGTTWKQIGTDLPAEPLNVVREDPTKESIIYIGSDNGLYTSFDLGKSFMSMSLHLPRVPIHDIAIQKRDNELVLGTHGRSIFITSLDSVQKIYDKQQKLAQMKASLRTFDPKQMNEGDTAIDCPPAKAPRRKNKMVPVKITSKTNH